MLCFNLTLKKPPFYSKLVLKLRKIHLLFGKLLKYKVWTVYLDKARQFNGTEHDGLSEINN